MEVSTKDLRLHTKALIAATDRGEEVIITWRGKPRAKLVPLDEAPLVDDGRAVGDAPAKEWDRRNPAFGLWRDRDESESVEGQVRRLRQRREL